LKVTKNFEDSLCIYTTHTCYKFVKAGGPQASDDGVEFMRQNTFKCIRRLAGNIFPEMFEIKLSLQSCSCVNAPQYNGCVNLHGTVSAPASFWTTIVVHRFKFRVFKPCAMGKDQNSVTPNLLRHQDPIILKYVMLVSKNKWLRNLD
jgi:hypothetical protein